MCTNRLLDSRCCHLPWEWESCRHRGTRVSYADCWRITPLYWQGSTPTHCNAWRGVCLLELLRLGTRHLACIHWSTPRPHTHHYAVNKSLSQNRQPIAGSFSADSCREKIRSIFSIEHMINPSKSSHTERREEKKTSIDISSKTYQKQSLFQVRSLNTSKQPSYLHQIIFFCPLQFWTPQHTLWINHDRC